MPKVHCKLHKEGIIFKEIKNPKYICKKCDSGADDKDELCKPTKQYYILERLRGGFRW
jgi:hypothetical protein